MLRQRGCCAGLLAALCFWLFAIFGIPPQAAERLLYEEAEKYALIIENKTYESPYLIRLEGTGGQLKELSQVLIDQYGFNVHFLVDATARRMQRAFRDLASRLGSRASLLIVYYGLCESDARSAYWLGIEADGSDLDILTRRSISASSISRTLKSIAARDVLLVTPNGCYSGTADLPLAEDAEISISEALSRRQRSRRIILMGPGSAQARIGVSFLREFTARLSNASQIMSADRVFLDVVERLQEENPAKAVDVSLQAIPLAGHRRGHFLFVPRDLEREALTQLPSKLSDPGESSLPRAFELEFWNTIKNETDPELFTAYLKTFPDGVFAALAKYKLAHLETTKIQTTLTEIGFPATGPQIERAQLALRTLGYDPGPTDGIWGKYTRDAIRAWQEAQGEETTGRLTREQYSRLEEEAFPSPPPKLAAILDPDMRPGEQFRDCLVCAEMVTVPAGKYVRSASLDSSGTGKKADGSEQTSRSVVVVRFPFAVSKFEVTFDEWNACAVSGGCDGYSPDDAGWGQGRRPVINVSYDDAQAYVEWISRRTGQRYRLLSENEWEFVARAGSATRYWWGDEASPDKANYGGKLSRTTAVGSYPSNHFGLHDTQGNVWELVEDCWEPNYYAGPSDQRVRGVTDCRRVGIRGGSWYDESSLIMSASRSGIRIERRFNNVGFRVARDLF